VVVVLLGLMLATLMGLFAFSVYRPEVLNAHAWIERLFWALVVTGVFRAGMDIFCCSVSRCRWPRLSRLLGCHRCPRNPCHGGSR